jgi:hypothetical protein
VVANEKVGRICFGEKEAAIRIDSMTLILSSILKTESFNMDCNG